MFIYTLKDILSIGFILMVFSILGFIFLSEAWDNYKRKKEDNNGL